VDDEGLLFGRVPAENLFVLRRRAEPFMSVLSDALGVPVRTRILSTYERVIEAMVAGEFDLVTIGPAGLIEAWSQGARYRAVCAPVRAGRSSYRSLIIAKEDSEIEDLEGLRDREIAFVSRRSTGGYLAAAATLRAAGLRPLSYQPTFVGSYDNVIDRVVHGSAAAGAIFEDARVFSKNPLAIRGTRILATSSAIPNEPVAVAESLFEQHPELMERLVATLLNIHESPDTVEALRSLWPTFDRFEAIEDERVFDRVRSFVLDESW
jgi:phosphonate transport system substrate-binding protein